MINSKANKEEERLVPTKRYVITTVVYAADASSAAHEPGTIVKIELDEQVTHNKPIGYGS